MGRIEDLEISGTGVHDGVYDCICILCYVNRGTIYGYYDILNYILLMEARLYDTRCYKLGD